MIADHAFLVTVTNDQMWNTVELYEYLIENKHKKIELGLNPDAACLEYVGLYKILDQFKFEEVIIHTKNAIEFHPKYKICIDGPLYGLGRFVFWPESDTHQWNQEKIFLCWYARPTANRLGLAAYCDTRYPNDSHVGCQGTIDTDFSRSHFELDKLFRYRAESLIEFGNLVNKLPMILNHVSKWSPYDNDVQDVVTKQLYKDIFVDIVSETFVMGDTFFPTEKTMRPLLFKKPFIMFGPRNFLIYLRQLGFKTFYEFWSEDYDSYEGGERFNMILKIIDSIASKSKTELYEMYQQMESILEHNYQIIVNRQWNTNLVKINE
jgi:hypothetical protein